MKTASIAFPILLSINFSSARLNSPDDEHFNSKFNEKHRSVLESDLRIRFSKVAFRPEKEDIASLASFPLTADDFPINPSNNDLLDILKESLCPSVTRLDDFEVFFDVRGIIEGDVVGGYPVHASSDPNSPFWGYMREVVEAQALRRVNAGSDPAIDVMPLPEIWSDFTLDMVAEAVHDEYPNYHQARNLARMIGRGQGVGYEIDNNIIPQRSAYQFLRGPVMIADMNTWATTVVGPHSFAAKFAVGRARPEEIAWSIKTGAISRQNVPSDIFDMIEAIPNFNAAVDFTAYEEGSPRHPSWPAMHSAASQTSFWMDIVLDLSPEELCQARLTDYGVAYARTIAGVHYPDDNIDGLNLGQEVIALALPSYLSWKYDADEQSVRDKIEARRYDWNTFDPLDPCPFVGGTINDGSIIALESLRYPGSYLDAGGDRQAWTAEKDFLRNNFRQWKIIEISDDIVALESLHYPGSYLDAGGNREAWTAPKDFSLNFFRQWRIIKISDDVIALESMRYPGSYLDAGGDRQAWTAPKDFSLNFFRQWKIINISG